MAKALRHYREIDSELQDCESTARFCERMNCLFDALNRVSREEGLTINSDDFKVCIVLLNSFTKK